MKFFFWRRNKDEELDEEIQSHLRMAARDRVERGESVEEAEQFARRQMGNVALVKETTRDVWGWRWLADAVQDLRYGMRMLRKNPAFSVMLIVTLAVGVGGTTAMYSVIEAVVLRPLPYVDDTRVMIVSGDNLKDLQKWGPTSFEILSDYYAGGANLVVTGATERILATETSEGFFEIFGVTPEIGRTYTPDESVAGRDNVAVLSDALWRREFGGSASALGKTVLVDELPYTIIGVMPPRFTFPGKTSVWVPMPKAGRSLILTRSEQPDLPLMMEDRIVARLREGVTMETARIELEDIRQRMIRAYVGTNQGATSYLGVNPISRVLSASYRKELYLLLYAGGFVLLIGCVNVAGLLLARGAVRRREIAVRLALGAGRWRVTRQLLSESFLLAALSSAAGIGLAWMLVALIRAYGPPDVPRLSEVNVNGTALLFALVIAQISGIVAALWPAFRSSGVQLSAALHRDGPGAAGRLSERGRRILTVAEIALALILAVGAGVALRGLHDTLKVDLGFQPENVLTMRVAPHLPNDAMKCRVFRDWLRLERLKRRHSAMQVVADGTWILTASSELRLQK
jgi:predicted permease